MSSEKYYDDEFHPRGTYPRNDGTKTRLWSIRLTEEEIANWDSKEIHGFLQGNTMSNDSIKISTLKAYLNGLYDIMVNKMNPKASLDQNEKELLIKISEVVGNE